MAFLTKLCQLDTPVLPQNIHFEIYWKGLLRIEFYNKSSHGLFPIYYQYYDYDLVLQYVNTYPLMIN